MGGVDLSDSSAVDNTYNNEFPYSSNTAWASYTNLYTVNWDECDLCLGNVRLRHPIVGDPDDSDPFYEGRHNITHAGPRYNVGIPIRGWHGAKPYYQGNFFGHSVAIWDSFDNGVDNYQFYHPLNGVFHGNTAGDLPSFYNIYQIGIGGEPDVNLGKRRDWRWSESKSGPFRRIESTVTPFGGSPLPYAYISPLSSVSENCFTPNDGCRDKQISRMEEYLNDFFSFAEWTFELNMNADDKPYDPDNNILPNDLSKEGWMEPSYMTLTDYTIKTVCIH